MSAIILAFFKNFDLHITIHDNFTANDSKELGPALEKKKKAGNHYIHGQNN